MICHSCILRESQCRMRQPCILFDLLRRMSEESLRIVRSKYVRDTSQCICNSWWRFLTSDIQLPLCYSVQFWCLWIEIVFILCDHTTALDCSHVLPISPINVTHTLQLYRTFYVHFVTRVERPLLEQLAQELQLSSSVSCVSKIYDQYLDLIALEPSLFTLNIPDSLISYNDPTLSETQIR